MERRAIAVYGATGYTGRLIAQELVEIGHEVVISGRARASLELLADDLPGPVRVVVAELTDDAALRDLSESVRTIVNAAGPFSATCAPVVAAAIDGGSHYVDISGEQTAIRLVLDDHAATAQEVGVA